MKKHIAVLATCLLTAGLSPFAANANTATPVYMETVAPGATLKVLGTTGDKVTGYAIPGIPDGMGVFMKDGKLQLLVNHEYSTTTAAGTQPRAGGAVDGGATVSVFSIDTATQTITAASEFLKTATWYDYSTKKYGSTPVAPTGAAAKDAYGTVLHNKQLNRFCSASYAPAGMFSAKVKGKTVGYAGGIYLTGEEGGDESRGFAINQSGDLVQLPRLGLAPWETFNAVPTGNEITAVIGTEDGLAIDSQLWMYVGKKSNTGTWYQKAGLTNGKSYVLSVEGMGTDTSIRAAKSKGVKLNASFEEVDWNQNGRQQNIDAVFAGTSFTRIEDGMFDPKKKNVFYFVTTESNKDVAATALDPNNKVVTKRDGGALWRLTFKDVKNPLKGATLEMLLDGSEAPYMNKPDNLVVDESGNVLIQEDPGNNAQLARVFAYNIASAKIAVIAQFKGEYFGSTASASVKITEDEESSGIIEVTSYFKTSPSDSKKYYLLNAQIHAATALTRPDITDTTAKAELEKLVEGGQLYLLTIDDWSKVEFK